MQAGTIPFWTLVLWHESWLGRLFFFICIYYSHSLPVLMLESFWMCLGLPASLNSITHLSQVCRCDTTRWRFPFAGWQQFCSSKEDSLIIMAKSLQQSTSVIACNLRVRNHLCSFNPVFDSFQSVEWFEDDCWTVGLHIRKVKSKDRKGTGINTFLNNGILKRCKQKKELLKPQN